MRRKNDRRTQARGAAALAVVVPLLLTGVAACGSDAGEGGDVTITFVWWGSDGRANLTKQAVELFQKKNPAIKVQTSFAAYAAYWEKLATQTAGGKPPDVMNVDTRYLAEYGGRNVLADLNQGAGKAVSLADVNPELAATGVYQGKRYAVPWAQNTPAMLYDPAAFTAAGADPAKGLGPVRRRGREGQRRQRVRRARRDRLRHPRHAAGDLAAPAGQAVLHPGGQARLQRRRPAPVLAAREPAARQQGRVTRRRHRVLQHLARAVAARQEADQFRVRLRQPPARLPQGEREGPRRRAVPDRRER
jgi:hypothetical protein